MRIPGTGGRPGFARSLALAAVVALGGTAFAAELEVFHADSLGGPMREMKKAIEAKRPGLEVKLTPGISRLLAGRIVKGQACDVFASSAPEVIDQDMLGKAVEGSGRSAAMWYVVFSANEMAIITAKGNPLAIRQVSDLLKPGVKFVRVNGEKDLATNRTIEFVKRAAAAEGKPEIAQKVIDSAVFAPGEVSNVPGTVSAVKDGKANAGIVYYSAAVAAGNDIDIVRFPDAVNMSEAIRNAATIPGTARNIADATAFVNLLLSAEGQEILKATGQPPVAPAIRKGAVPADIGAGGR